MHYYCDQAGVSACFQGESDVPQAYYDSSAQIVSRTGNQIIGTTIPESSTWAMLLAGFAALGYAGYRRAAAPAFFLRYPVRPSASISAFSVATVEASASPSTRSGRKWRWKAMTTARVSRS
jgi:hypothetical protein